ncbi:MAG TPA: POTRA domain-containing protein, partial [Bacteroidales bacterium]|nr:POTRA domain-containing protein [Bacteroidales bacterium]
KVFLDIYLKERPRLSKFVMKGVSKSDSEDLTEKLKIKPGVQVTDNLLNNISIVVKKHYAEKGFLNTQVKLIQVDDTLSRNRVLLTADIDKRHKVKIKQVDFIGNDDFSDKRLRRTLKKTKQKDWNIFTGAKYIESKFKEDKDKLEEFYSKNGYRDFKIMNDSITVLNEDEIVLHIRVHEGNQFHIRNVAWVGNTIYPSELLNRYFKMKKGDVYDQVSMEKRLTTDEDAVNSLYLDNGYLFFRLTPIETVIEGDSIDLEMRINEGRQATINNIIISGNTKTNEHVIRRELRTRPGELFSKSNIIRSVRELANLGHFDPEKISPDVLPNPSEGNVDIHYKLVEKANDQLEVSGGWGAGMLVGTIGIRFSNFSVRNFFKPGEWRPVPSGDGQSLSIRAQSNGKYYRSYNISFMDPWFGGKKPNSFSVSAYLSKMHRYNYSYFGGSNDDAADSWYKVSGVSVGFGKRLTWPDDWFFINNEFSYQLYTLHNYSLYGFPDDNGKSNNISFTTTLTRSSQDQQIYPRTGSNFSFSLQLTPNQGSINEMLYER